MKTSKLTDPPVVETPNARMQVYASPEVNGSPVAVWRTDMVPGAAGPTHIASETQVLVVLEGAAMVSVDGGTSSLRAGESILLPAGAQRQVAVAGAQDLAMLLSSLPNATAQTEDSAPVSIPWTR
jgi:quercetin dioxygenase-like cupin family protein